MEEREENFDGLLLKEFFPKRQSVEVKGECRMNYKTIKVAFEEGIATVTFNRPEKLNAMSEEFLTEMNDFMDSLTADEETRVVILTGAGKAFIAGADVTVMQNMTPLEAADYAFHTTEIYRKMENSGKVFIAAINGYAFGGGCEMTLACDLRIASEKARFGLPEVGLGIFPGGGGTQRLPRLIGMAKAKELIFSAETFKADKAKELGLVSQVVPPEELMPAAREVAAKILKNSKVGVELAKQSMNYGVQVDMYSAINQEKNLFAMCFGTEEQRKRMDDFVNKK